MVKGFFVGNIPFVEVTVASRSAVQREVFIVDTGFSGDLQVTPKVAKDLGLSVDSVKETTFGDGSVKRIPSAQAVSSMEFKRKFVNVMISSGSPLAGMSLFKRYGFKVTVCCKTQHVELEEEP